MEQVNIPAMRRADGLRLASDGAGNPRLGVFGRLRKRALARTAKPRTEANGRRSRKSAASAVISALVAIALLAAALFLNDGDTRKGGLLSITSGNGNPDFPRAVLELRHVVLQPGIPPDAR